MTEMVSPGVIADRLQRLQKATVTTGDLGGAGEAPTSVSQGNVVCPECGREGGRHKKGCSCVGEKEVGLTKSTPADKTPKPFSSSKTSNWVARAGGLPNYVQHVAHALVKKGKTESQAIRMAIGIMKNWAEGKGDVSDAVRAAAGKALAQWERMKASTRVKKELADEVDSVSLDDPDIVWAMERAGLEICKEDIVNKAFDPDQPRGPDGRWIELTGAIHASTKLPGRHAYSSSQKLNEVARDLENPFTGGPHRAAPSKSARKRAARYRLAAAAKYAEEQGRGSGIATMESAIRRHGSKKLKELL